MDLQSAKFGYKSDRLTHNVYGTRSNIASTTAGFTLMKLDCD
jgi:hypothetical protein